MKRTVFPIFFSLLFFSCTISYQPQALQYNYYQVSNIQQQDASLTGLLKPYTDSINKSMNDIIGYNESQLVKKQGMNTLGYFMTDAYLYMARKKFNRTVHAAFMNHGGIRLPELPAGNITRGKIYELMPFDNLMLLITIKGSMLKQLLDTLAANDGIIVSGLSMQVKNRIVSNVMVDGKPLDENADYFIANSDYSTNNSVILKSLPQQNIGYLQRDALLDYVNLQKKDGKNISLNDKNRISYVE